MNLTTHELHFTAQAVTPLELDQQSGSPLRGAIAGALHGRFCVNQSLPTCTTCPLVAACPVAALVAPMREEGQKGSSQRPRPYVVRPPQDGKHHYAPGDTFSFSLVLMGQAADLFPHLIIAVREMEHAGLGRKLQCNGGKRGRIHLLQIEAVHPLRGMRQVLYQAGQSVIEVPGAQVQPEEVAPYAATLPSNRITLHFKTPLRLVDNQRLVQQIALRPLLQRLMRRLDDLCRAYGRGALALDFRGLLAQAEQVQVVDNQTHWVNLKSYSSRQGRSLPIGGLVGHATFEGDLTHLRDLLVWGALVHVGKNAVKGDGWYAIAPLT